MSDIVSQTASAIKIQPQQRLIQLKDLLQSSENVRTAPASAEKDAELRASIRHLGLLQNLVVRPVPGKKLFEVVAGGRRLKIMQDMAQAGEIPWEQTVPCFVRKDGVIEASLAENTVRASMHPADEYAAMAKLVAHGKSVIEIARDFGTSEAVVEKRLRLGNVHPTILDAYRANELSSEQIMAFACVTDQTAQLRVYELDGNPGDLSAWQIKRKLQESKTRTDAPMVRFVGLNAYLAAGGTLTTDLFARDQDIMIDDPTLIVSLAQQKLEQIADDLRRQWAWVVVLPELGHAMPTHLHKMPCSGIRADLGELNKQLDAVCGTIDALEAEWPEEVALDEDCPEELRGSWQQIVDLLNEKAQIETSIASAGYYTDEDRAKYGCAVTILYDGSVRVVEGLCRPEDMPQSSPAAGRDKPHREHAMEAIAVGGGQGLPAQDNSLDPDEPSAKLSQVLMNDLLAHRHQIMTAHLADDFTMAFDLAAFSVASQVLGSRYGGTPVNVTVQPQQLRDSLDELNASPAGAALARLRESLDLSWVGKPALDSFLLFRGLSQTAKQAIFAYCVANGMQASLDIGKPSIFEWVGQHMQIDVAAFWRPTAANYWGRVPKTHSLEIASRLFGSRWAADMRESKRAVIADRMERAFARDNAERAIGLAGTTLAQAASWLPAGMGFARVEQADDDTAAEENAATPVETQPVPLSVDGPVEALPDFLTAA